MYRDTMLTLLIEWLTLSLSECNFSSPSQVHSTYSRQLLPVLAKVLPDLSPSHHLACLKMAIWSIVLLPEVYMPSVIS